MTDLHSHILPGIDDGSASVAESIAMLQQEAAQGVTHVVATPHFYPRYETPDAFLAKRDQAEALLRREMEKYPGLPALSVGAEVYYFRGISESEYLPRLTTQGKSCILIEMPHTHWTDAMYAELEAIWTRWGIRPIIAHIDRYIAPFRTHGIPERLERLPVLVQANGDFFLDKSTASLAMRLLRRDRIQLLGTDCHGIEARKPNLGPVVERIRQKLGQEALDRIESYEHLCFALND